MGVDPDHAKFTPERAAVENEAETGDACESAHLGKTASTLDCDGGFAWFGVTASGQRTLGSVDAPFHGGGCDSAWFLAAAASNGSHNACTRPNAGMVGRICA